MKLLWKLAIPQLCIVLGLSCISYFVINSSFKTLRERYVKDIVENHFRRVETDLAASSQLTVNTSALFARLPQVADAYALAMQGNTNDEKSPQSQQAREQLRLDLAPMLDSYKTYAGEKLQLAFPFAERIQPCAFVARQAGQKKWRMGGHL